MPIPQITRFCYIDILILLQQCFKPVTTKYFIARTAATILCASRPSHLDEKFELFLSQVTEILLQLDGDLQGEQQLVFLEDTCHVIII